MRFTAHTRPSPGTGPLKSTPASPIPPSPTSKSKKPCQLLDAGHKQAAIDAGERPGTTTSDAQRIKKLEAEVRELKRANEILLAASSFFARELDPRLPW